MLDFKRDVQQLVAEDFAALDHFIHYGVSSRVALVMAVSEHVVQSGGKRLRPLMCLLTARALLPGQLTAEQRERVIRLAAIVEMLHTATLVHDDVVDESGLRRGVATANTTWGNATAVLVGDFLIARSFDLLVQLDLWPLVKAFSAGTCEIAEGEVLQLQHQHNPDATEADYLQIVYGKTSRLFMLAAQGTAMLLDQPAYHDALGQFAIHFGNAFQIIDDVLDYTSDAGTLGKNIGDDLTEGKPTLPLITTLTRSQGADQAFVRHCIQTGKLNDLARLQQLMQTTGALDYCRQRAQEETQSALQALSALPHNAGRQALYNLTELAAQRLF